ncbi:polymorphic toxin type 24 domain-containing protein [Cytobacillus horneckiae]|uniref:polymorphic toxin type 24 domain-containing protein n=1 Tax=Cytobacillus horneckiae TaxID=549687 RepID=UPI003D9A39E5
MSIKVFINFFGKANPFCYVGKFGVQYDEDTKLAKKYSKGVKKAAKATKKATTKIKRSPSKKVSSKVNKKPKTVAAKPNRGETVNRVAKNAVKTEKQVVSPDVKVAPKGGNTQSTEEAESQFLMKLDLQNFAENKGIGGVEKTSKKSRSTPTDTGIPDSTLISRDIDENITKYTTFGSDGKIVKEVRLTGKDHGNIPRPNAKEPSFNVNPKNGQKFQNGYKVRPIKNEEVPRSYK